jgi:uncharacterized protein YhdP
LVVVDIIDFQMATTDGAKLDLDIAPSDIPNLFISTNNVIVNGHHIPNFSTLLESEGEVLDIIDLTFHRVGTGKHELHFNGTWEAGKTQLTAKARGGHLADFLEQLNIKTKVHAGEFYFHVDLLCECAPWNASLKNMTGHLDMSIKEGTFDEKDPHLGRVLSLLNIKSLAKHLKLETQDVTQEGFAYDHIEASANIGNSLLKIEKFKLNSSSSTIELSGNTNLVQQRYDLLAKVVPAVSDAIPIATYLAGGGLAGLGVWLVDEVLFDGEIIHSIVDGVAEFDYKIIGTWEKPIIE